jgi:hypothetical protein
VSSRGDIESCAWNEALFAHVPHGFLSAVKFFNEGELRYSWLRYLPFGPFHSNLFQGLTERTLQLLSTNSILESLQGDLVRPSGLIYVPDRFRDDEGMPLVPGTASKSKYLSNKYPSSLSCLEKLRRLGLKPLSPEAFLHDLAAFISNDGARFQEMPGKWQSLVSSILLSLVATDNGLKETISLLPIVPLSDGRWVCPDAGALFFHSKTDLVPPKDIPAFEIRLDASGDLNRQNLFRLFGAMDANGEEICNIIVRTHMDPQFHPQDIPTKSIIYHVLFLYKNKWAREGDLWFISEHGSYHRGSQIYLDVDKPFSAARMFAKHKSIFHFLHQDYTKAFNGLDSWMQWLREILSLSECPRFVIRDGPTSFTLSVDFQFLMDRCPSSDVLLLLKRWWSKYSEWVVPDKPSPTYSVSREQSKRNLIAAISSMTVACRGGKIAPLSQTFLPRTGSPSSVDITLPKSREDLSMLGDMTLLDVPDPGLKDWDLLEYFGVVRLQASVFINRLRQLKGTKISGEGIWRLYEDARRLYEHIQAFVGSDDERLVRYVKRLVINKEQAWS